MFLQIILLLFHLHALDRINAVRVLFDWLGMVYDDVMLESCGARRNVREEKRETVD